MRTSWQLAKVVCIYAKPWRLFTPRQRIPDNGSGRTDRSNHGCCFSTDPGVCVCAGEVDSCVIELSMQIDTHSRARTACILTLSNRRCDCHAQVTLIATSNNLFPPYAHPLPGTWRRRCLGWRWSNEFGTATALTLTRARAHTHTHMPSWSPATCHQHKIRSIRRSCRNHSLTQTERERARGGRTH